MQTPADTGPNQQAQHPRPNAPLSFQELIITLQRYWIQNGCVIEQPYDMEMGAGTFHPSTFLRAIGPEPWSSAYVQPVRRPADGRYGDNPNRLQHYYQFQVFLKPSPPAIQDLYLHSLQALGIDLMRHDIRFVEDNWESPTLGAWGLGWEIWLDGMEISQFTYFQQAGGLDCKPVAGEITYGLERIALCLQDAGSVYDLIWARGEREIVSYGDLHRQTEREMSAYNFEHADIDKLNSRFADCEQECHALIKAELALPAYEQVLKASHLFNLLDARHALSVTERQRYILSVRTLARAVAKHYLESRQTLGMPLIEADRPESPPAQKRSQKRSMSTESAQTRTLLLEIGTEELPPGALSRIATALAAGIEQELQRQDLQHGQLHWYATPRRLAVTVSELVSKRKGREKLHRGPLLKDCYDEKQCPTAAARGFAASCGTSLDQLEQVADDRGIRLVHRSREPDRETTQLLPELLGKVLQRLPDCRYMRWGPGQIEFIRPVHWVVLLLGTEWIEIELLGCKTGRHSQGHRLLDPEPFELKQASDYPPESWHVQADYGQRREYIRELVATTAQKVGGMCHIEEPLLEEVTALVEWPVAVHGQFPERYLSLPREVLIAVMQNQQRFFPVFHRDRPELLSSFISIVNMESPEMEQVRRGNERVIVPRMADAEFFWQRDQSRKLEEYQEKLHTLVFHQGLGSMYEKSERLAGLAAWIAEQLEVPAAPASRAAELCKCDLLSEMVGEFPMLQGCAGGYYARHSGEPTEIAEAISEHYQPGFSGDRTPATILGNIVSLSDKIDTLTGIFSIGKAPDGEKDPFGLRRAALGCIRILIEGALPLNLRDLTSRAQLGYQAQIQQGKLPRVTHCLGTSPGTNDEPETPPEIPGLIDFILERMRSLYLDQGVPATIFEAVRATGVTEPVDFNARVQAIREFQSLPESGSLIAANKRIRNILRRAGQRPATQVRQELLQEPAERDLAERCAQLQIGQDRDYTQALRQLATLQKEIDRFFDEVHVMSETPELRDNRTALLYHLSNMFNQIADISRL